MDGVRGVEEVLVFLSLLPSVYFTSRRILPTTGVVDFLRRGS